MKIIALILISFASFGQNEPQWRRVHLPGMEIDIPIRDDGTPDHSRLQRRADLRITPSVLTPNTNPLWPLTRNTWTEADEAAYSSWVAANVRESFFHGTNLSVDCADAAIALRWIFAREQGLPAGQTLAGSGRLFGSWESTNEWDLLPVDADWRKDERFKAGVRYLLNNVYTHSILKDLYPVEITPNYLVPGAIYLTLYLDSGHTRTLLKVGSPQLEFIAGNEPSSTDMYPDYTIPYWVPETEGGFMRFRWPENTAGVWSLRAADQMPGFNKEQYAWGDYNYSTKFNERMELWDSEHEQIITTAAQLVKDINSRLVVVERGFFICALVPCAPKSPEDDKYSTPQRDHRLGELANLVSSLIARLPAGDWLRLDLMQKNSSPVIGGSALTYWDLFSRGAVAKLNSDPTQSILTRWGVPPAGAATEFDVRAEAFSHNWRWRETLVRQAQDLCFPNGVTTPQCDPAGKEALALNTSRLDQAFRLEKIYLNNLFAQFTPQEKAWADLTLGGFRTQLAACPASPHGFCTAKDLLTENFVDVMTAGAADPLNQRNGNP